jgi:hypothetical protein
MRTDDVRKSNGGDALEVFGNSLPKITRLQHRTRQLLKARAAKLAHIMASKVSYDVSRHTYNG